MGHLISKSKFKIPTPPSPLLISDKSLKENGTGQYLVWVTQRPRKGDLRELKSKKFPGCPQTKVLARRVSSHPMEHAHFLEEIQGKFT